MTAIAVQPVPDRARRLHCLYGSMAAARRKVYRAAADVVVEAQRLGTEPHPNSAIVRRYRHAIAEYSELVREAFTLRRELAP